MHIFFEILHSCRICLKKKGHREFQHALKIYFPLITTYITMVGCQNQQVDMGQSRVYSSFAINRCIYFVWFYLFVQEALRHRERNKSALQVNSPNTWGLKLKQCLPHGRQELNCLNHCLPESVLLGSWKKEPQLVWNRGTSMEVTGVLTDILFLCLFSFILHVDLHNRCHSEDSESPIITRLLLTIPFRVTWTPSPPTPDHHSRSVYNLILSKILCRQKHNMCNLCNWLFFFNHSESCSVQWLERMLSPFLEWIHTVEVAVSCLDTWWTSAVRNH